jgi:hypothetical protein
MAAGSLAVGSVTHYVADVDNTDVMGYDFWTFDLHVVITGDPEDDWTSTCADAYLIDCPDCCVFYQEPTFGDNVPLPPFFDLIPELEFDCWYTGPDGFPNTNEAPSIGFAGDVITEDWLLSACWFDTANTGEGDFSIARFTMGGDCCCWDVLRIEGATKIASTGDLLHPFSFTVLFPEPGMLALLGMGVALIRRR